MPWQEHTVMSARAEFLVFAQQEDANLSALCRQFSISRKTAYKWLGRVAAGEPDLGDRSRRPHTSPQRTDPAVEAAVLVLRDQHPAWGGRKLHQLLARQELVQPIPAPSTITAILRRHGRLAAPERPQRDWLRFEAAAPNDLWPLDFMGYPDLPRGKVHPLTVLDDHSRFAVVLAACAQAGEALVREHLSAAFARYGLPRRILTDNGPPWGTAGAGGLSALEAWWLGLGIAVSHGRPAHPQTQGKVERLHRTIWAEVPGIHTLPDLATAQAAFDHWRMVYNLERPHEALGMAVPASRYQPSPHPFPPRIPSIAYGPDDAVRRVFHPGRIAFHGQKHFISHGLIGLAVAVRTTSQPNQFTVWYGPRQVATIDLTKHP